MLNAQYACLFVFLYTSGSDICKGSAVYFTRTPQTVISDNYKMCFGSNQPDCIELSKAQYEYYTRTSAALEPEETPVVAEDHTGLRATVDSLMFEFLNGEQLDGLNCVPFVSSYTDCTRENICTGCQRCVCDESSNWKCTQIQECTPHKNIVIDAKVLQQLMDLLTTDKDVSSDREKRDLKRNHIDYSTILQWLYSNHINLERAIHTRNKNTIGDNNYEYDPVVFDEIYNSINNRENNTRRKALQFDFENSKDSKNNLNLIHDNALTNQITISEEYKDTDTTNKASNIVIDLLQSTNQNSTDFNDKDAKLVKRDVSVTTTSNVEEADSVKKLKVDILYPLTSVIDGKQKEIDELLKIRKKLIRFLMEHKNIDIESSDKNVEITESPYVSIYKIEIQSETPDHATEFKRMNNSALVDKYFTKLKKDIYEVIKDIVGIQKYSNTRILPVDLRVLIRAMRYYVRHQDELLFNNKVENESNVPTTKDIQLSLREKKVDITFIKENLKKILKAIHDTPIPEAIDYLSPETYKVIKRFIGENYFCDDYGTQFNLTIDIKDVGTTWNPIMKEAENASPIDKLAYMKLLYLILNSDMSKVNHALNVLVFAKNRRMAIDGHLVPFVGKRIEFALSKVSQRLNNIIKLNENPDSQHLSHIRKPLRHIKIHGYSEKSSKRKKSMLRHIHDVLKTSKHDIVNLIRHKVPKTEIIKTIANKKFGIISKEQRLQEVMENWQRNLNVSSSRHKRSSKKIIYNKKKTKGKTLMKKGKNKLTKKPKKYKYSNRKSIAVTQVPNRHKLIIPYIYLPSDKKSNKTKTPVTNELKGVKIEARNCK